MITTEDQHDTGPGGFDSTDDGLNVGFMSDEELAEELLSADRRRSLAEADELKLLGEFDARNCHKADGAGNARVWLAARADLTRSDAGLMVQDARKLRRHPESEAACRRIGTAHVREFIRRVHPRVEPVFDETETIVLGNLARFTVDDVIKFAKAWARMVDPDGSEPPENKPDLSMGITGDGLFGRFALFGEDAAFMARAIDHEADRIFRGEGEDHSPAGERRSQALINLVKLGFAADQDTEPVRPTVIVHITLEELLERVKLNGQVDPGGLPISDHALRRLLCDANLHRFITGPDGVVLNLGRKQRLVTAQQRIALIARDRHCQFPGCERQPNICHAHHIERWEQGGTTDLPNLLLLCHQHHHTVHEGGFGCARAPDGTIQFTRPNGTRLEPQPRPG